MNNFKNRRRGFTLVEVIAAGVAVTILGISIASVYVREVESLNQTYHALQAIIYARSAAEKLVEMGRPWVQGVIGEPVQLTTGTHTADTNPDICALPEGYFKLQLNGAMKYIVEDASSGGPGFWGGLMRRIEIVVEWREKGPASPVTKESLFVAIFYPNPNW